jgi:hypothetical protein
MLQFQGGIHIAAIVVPFVAVVAAVAAAVMSICCFMF